MYGGHFDKHMGRLISFDFRTNTASGNKNRYNYNMRRYMGLQQAAFENSDTIESGDGNEVNWKQVDRLSDKFAKQSKSLLGNDAASSELGRISRFTADSFRYFLTYRQMYPKSNANPWQPILDIYGDEGFLFYVTDNDDELSEMVPRLKSRLNDENHQGNIGIVVKGKGTGLKSLSGFIVDRRYQLQTLVHDFLKKHAYGSDNLISQRNLETELKAHFKKNRIHLSVQNLQERVLTPLKKTGTVGSTGQGFFYIASKEDLVKSWKFHRTKMRSMERIMLKYQDRGEEFGVDLNDDLLDGFS